MEISKEMLDGLSEEMRSKIDACESAEDLIDLAESEGVELTDDQLEMVAGGGDAWIDCIQ